MSQDRPIVVSQQLAYSQRQAAAMLGISESTFKRHIRPQLPPPVFVGGRVLFKHRDLERWLNKQ
jgi:excisionase family DNA binding protein